MPCLSAGLVNDWCSSSISHSLSPTARPAKFRPIVERVNAFEGEASARSVRGTCRGPIRPPDERAALPVAYVWHLRQKLWAPPEDLLRTVRLLPRERRTSTPP